MKKIIIIAATLAATLIPAVSQAQDIKDTVTVKADTIIVSQSDRATVKVTDRGRVQLDFDIPFYRKLKYDSHAVIGAMGVGMMFTAPEMSFHPQNSLEYFIYALDSKTKGHNTFSFGPGVTFCNYGMTGTNAMTMDDDGNIVIGSFPASSVPKISKLRVFSINAPLLYSFSFGDGFGFTLGPVVNLNASSSIVNKYSVNGEKQKDKYKNAHCNIVTVDAMFQLNLKYLSLYVKYSPMNVMDTKYWQGFQTWTFGIAPF